MQAWFGRFSERVARAAGHPVTFTAALAVVLAWAAAGPVLGFSEAWQLTINTGTTIVTFLMVFVIVRTQNRHERALQAKIDELLRALPEADDSLRGIEAQD